MDTISSKWNIGVSTRQVQWGQLQEKYQNISYTECEYRRSYGIVAGTEPAGDYKTLYGHGNEKYELVMQLFVQPYLIS
jgi:hypothetical protein